MLDIKKLYYYVICVIALFVLLWGVVDLTSSSVSLVGLRNAAVSSADAPLSPDKGDQMFDAYYQKKMMQDRLWDSLARILVSGVVFAYFRMTANKLDKG